MTKALYMLNVVLCFAVIGLALNTLRLARVVDDAQLLYGGEVDRAVGAVRECTGALVQAREAAQTEDWSARVTAEQFIRAANGAWECGQEPTCQYADWFDLLSRDVCAAGWYDCSEGWSETARTLDQCRRELEWRRGG